MKSKKTKIFKFLVTFALIPFIFHPVFAIELDLEKRVHEFTLANGMKVLMMERHTSPTVSFIIRFKVGAVDEKTDNTGIAHFLEHLKFKGTKTIGTKNYNEEKKILDKIDEVAIKRDTLILEDKAENKEEIEKLTVKLKGLQKKLKNYIIKDEIHSIYSQNGAVGFNAFTSQDLTSYVVSLPSNRLELFFVIESDRMLNSVLREFYSEREVIMEERRQTLDSKPHRKLLEHFLATAFMAHPYGIPTIGWSEDMKSMSKEKVSEFNKTFYAPNNSVIAIVGDINVNNTLSLLKKYFERIPAQKLPRRVVTKEPVQLGERRIKVAMDANPNLIIGFHKKTIPAFEDYVFDVIDSLLSRGRTSRFYKNLVETGLALNAYAANGYPGARYKNLFTIFATPQLPHTYKEVEDAVYKELERLKTELVSERELKKIKNQMEADLIWSLNSNYGIADTLSYFQALIGDWHYILKHLEIIEKITPEDIKKISKRVFVPKNRTVAYIVKKIGNED
jgi:predicted Zn-dependent peptidase